MNKYVIYTALIGNYDDIRQPLAVDNRFDYILYMDNPTQSRIGVWEVRKFECDNLDLTRVARYIKTHPHELLPDYEASMWIDARIQITHNSFYIQFIEMYSTSYDVAASIHPLRDCIYDEAYEVMNKGLELEQKVFEWCHYLREESYPQHNGLYETGVLFRKHNDEVLEMDKLWWQYIQTYSRRDQLSFNYVLSKLHVKCASFFQNGESLRKTSCMICHQHSSTASSSRRVLNHSFGEHARVRCRVGLPEKYDAFKSMHYRWWGYPVQYGLLCLYLWGVYATILYGPIIKYKTYLKHKRQENT